MSVEMKHTLVRREHWLTRAKNIRLLRRIFGAVLAATVLAQAFVPVHARFGADGILGFAALYGFAGCVVMVVIAKILGWWLQRSDDYYLKESQFLWTASVEPAQEWHESEEPDV